MRRCAAKVQLPSECRISHSSRSSYFDAVALRLKRGKQGISVKEDMIILGAAYCKEAIKTLETFFAELVNAVVSK